jgi:hypothetical protein
MNAQADVFMLKTKRSKLKTVRKNQKTDLNAKDDFAV